MLDTPVLLAIINSWMIRKPRGVLIKDSKHEHSHVSASGRAARRSTNTQSLLNTPSCSCRIHEFTVPFHKHYRHLQKATWAVTSPGTWGNNIKEEFLLLHQKNREKMPKKLVLRSSQKMSSSVQMLDQLYNAMFWCDQHRPSQLCQKHLSAMGLPCIIHISPGKPELFGNVYPWDLLPVSGIVQFCPWTAFPPSQACMLVFLPVFSFSKSAFFTSHSSNTRNVASWQTDLLESPFFMNIWASGICCIYYLLQHDTSISSKLWQTNNIQKNINSHECSTSPHASWWILCF